MIKDIHESYFTVITISYIFKWLDLLKLLKNT